MKQIVDPRYMSVMALQRFHEEHGALEEGQIIKRWIVDAGRPEQVARDAVERLNRFRRRTQHPRAA